MLRLLNSILVIVVLGLCALAYGQDSPPDADGEQPWVLVVEEDTSAAAADTAAPAPKKRVYDSIPINEFSEEVINSLFGARIDPKDTAAAVRELPPFEGTYKIMISRPIYAAYDLETKSKWVSAVSELYTYYKVSSFPRTRVFTMEQADGVMPRGWRNYNRKFNRPHFVEAARKLGATHVIYQEYQPDTNGREAMFAMELYWIAEGVSVAKVFDTVKYADFENRLDKSLTVIANAIDSTAKNTAAFKQRVFPGARKFLEPFGNILADEGTAGADTLPAQTRAASAYASAGQFLAEYGGHIGVQYALALLAARAGDYAKAAEHIGAVMSKPGNYYALYLLNASYLRRAGQYALALRAAETAASDPILKTTAAIEMARIHAARGDTERARSIYRTITQSGDADAAAYFEYARIDAIEGRYEESEISIAAASQRNLQFGSGQYRELGIAFGKDPARSERAVALLMQSMGANLNDTRTWTEIIDIHRRAGNKEKEAEALANIFRIDPREGNLEYVRAAGELYAELGHFDKAKTAYNMVLSRNYFDRDISLALARIYLAENDCAKLPNVIRWIDTIPEAAKMLVSCGFRVLDESQTISAKKASKIMIAARLSAGTAALGALAGGLVLNNMVQEEGKRYRDYAPEGAGLKGTTAENYGHVQSMRKNIDRAMFQRNLLYAVSVLSAAGLTVTLFF